MEDFICILTFSSGSLRYIAYLFAHIRLIHPYEVMYSCTVSSDAYVLIRYRANELLCVFRDIGWSLLWFECVLNR